MKFCWTTINVRDMDTSLAFYREVIGLNLNRTMKPGPGIEIAFLGSGETQIELIHNANGAGGNFGGDISLGFEIDSISTILDVLKEKNIPVHSGPFQPNPHIKFIFILDPDGLKIQFVENIP